MTLDDYVGRTETREDMVWPLLARGLAATLGVPEPKRELPPLWDVDTEADLARLEALTVR